MCALLVGLIEIKRQKIGEKNQLHQGEKEETHKHRQTARQTSLFGKRGEFDISLLLLLLRGLLRVFPPRLVLSFLGLANEKQVALFFLHLSPTPRQVVSILPPVLTLRTLAEHLNQSANSLRALLWRSRETVSGSIWPANWRTGELANWQASELKNEPESVSNFQFAAQFAQLFWQLSKIN